MMLRKSLPLLYTMLGLFTLAIVVSLGQPPVAKVPNPVIEPERPEALAEKLGDRDYDTREAAMKSLREMGSAAMPAIREALKSNNPEVQRRAKELLGQMEYVEKLEPTRVTLQSDGMYLTDALAELTKQAHFYHEIGEQNILPQKHALNLQNVTYWEAMDRISTLWGQGVAESRRGKSYTLTQYRKRSPFWVNSGSFQIELSNVISTRHYRFTSPTRVRTKSEGKLDLEFCIRAEPRFIILTHEPVIWELAIDLQGRSLLDDKVDEDLDSMSHQDPEISHDFVSTLNAPSRQSTTAKTLKGYLPVCVVVQQTPVLLTENVLTSEGRRIKLDGIELHIRKIERDRNQYAFTVDLTDAKDELSAKAWIDRFRLVDHTGHRLSLITVGGMGGEHAGVKLYTSADSLNSLKPASLMFMEWKIVRHLVPFTFHNVPLP